MVGGTHADHGDIEERTFETYSVTSVPYTATQIDFLCKSAEAGILTFLPTGAALPTTENTQWKQIIVDIVLNMMDLGTARKRGRGASSISGDTGSETLPPYGASPYTEDIILRAQTLYSITAGVAYGDCVSG
jgi:hypothetical protein